MAMQALDAATRAIAEELSLERVLQLIVDRVRPLVSAQYAAIGTVDESGRMQRFITSGIDREARERIGATPQGHGLLGLIIRESRAVRIEDIATDPRRYGFPPHHPEMHSFLGVPVTVRGRSVGNLYLTNKVGRTRFSKADQELVETFALHAGIAIENARLHEELQRLAVVEERERIGADLHDGIIQSLYAVGLALEDVPDLMREAPHEAAARVEGAIDAIHHAIRDIRNFIFGLQPELLEGTTLRTGVAALVEEFRHNSTIDIELAIDARSHQEPAEALSREVLAVLSEALANVTRHSSASRAVVRLRMRDGEITLTVSDNGSGFATGTSPAVGHQGLRNMRDRAARLGGELRIESEPGSGTRVMLRTPLHPLSRG